MRSNQPYMTLDIATQTVLPHLSSDSRLIVTGQIGCGKTTLAEKISVCLGLTHLPLDDLHNEASPGRAAAQAISRVDGGWVAEANVWQIPESIWACADLVVFLDYPNLVHYVRILRRCFVRCAMKPNWTSVRESVSDEAQHLRIMHRYASKNREGWRQRGGIALNTATQTVRCSTPREANRLLACLGTQTSAQPGAAPDADGPHR